jgi:putative ABC transport system permease protein
MAFDFGGDVRFALRLLGKSPGITVISVLSLALGIGATSAVFSLVDGLLLHPLRAIDSPEELVAVVGTHSKEPSRFQRLSWADYLDYAGHTEAVRALAATVDCDLTLTHSGPAERISGLAVSANYFEVLRLAPAYGRLISRGDEAAPVAVLGYGLWQRRFGGAPAVVGSSIALNGKRLTVVGIAPRSFVGTDLAVRREVWVPLGAYRDIAAGVLVPFSGKHDRGQEWLHVIGRLASGESAAGAQARFDVAAKSLGAAYRKTNSGRGVRVLPLAEVALGFGSQGRPLLLGFAARLLAVMILVLLVATMNVGGLLLARALGRRREIAIRLSLGADRVRLLRQLLTEGAVLGAMGAAGGIALAKAGLRLLERIELPVSLEARDLHLSGRVLGFSLGVSLASCLMFALIPALQAARGELVPGLRAAVRRGRRLRLGLHEIVACVQVAAALLILTAAGLLLRTVANLGSIDPGFDPARVLATTIDLAPAGYKGPSVAVFYRDLLARLRNLPGIADASMASGLPVAGADLEVDLSVAPEGALDSGVEGASQPAVRHVLVGSRFFHTMGMRILRGRDFGPEDDSGMGVVIINQTAERLLWPGRDALGRGLRLTQTSTPFVVVGIVADATYASLKENAVPVLYLAHAQATKSFIGKILAPQMTLLLRTTGKPQWAVGTVRELVRNLDPRLPVFRTTTLEELLAATVGVERQAATLYAGLAVIALALAMLGLYGVLTRTLVERTREIGIRMACGASPGEVRRLLLRRSAVLAGCGVVAGLVMAAPADRLVASLLYGVKAYDLATWLCTVLALMAVALLVSVGPAGRAAGIDPVKAMKHE